MNTTIDEHDDIEVEQELIQIVKGKVNADRYVKELIAVNYELGVLYRTQDSFQQYKDSLAKSFTTLRRLVYPQVGAVVYCIQCTDDFSGMFITTKKLPKVPLTSQWINQNKIRKVNIPGCPVHHQLNSCYKDEKDRLLISLDFSQQAIEWITLLKKSYKINIPMFLWVEPWEIILEL